MDCFALVFSLNLNPNPVRFNLVDTSCLLHVRCVHVPVLLCCSSVICLRLLRACVVAWVRRRGARIGDMATSCKLGNRIRGSVCVCSVNNQHVSSMNGEVFSWVNNKENKTTLGSCGVKSSCVLPCSSSSCKRVFQRKPRVSSLHELILTNPCIQIGPIVLSPPLQ